MLNNPRSEATMFHGRRASSSPLLVCVPDPITKGGGGGGYKTGGGGGGQVKFYPYNKRGGGGKGFSHDEGGRGGGENVLRLF